MACAPTLGTQPVLLSNGNGWANVTRFASLSLSKIAEMKQKAKLTAACALLRCLARLEEDQMRGSLLQLQHCTQLEAVLAGKRQAEEKLRRLRVTVDSMDFEVDESVEAICRHVLDEEHEMMDLFLKD
eukprot:g22482.t1